MLNVDLIKELRARTHLGMAECKKALEEHSGDLNRAIEALQKRGLKKVDDLLLPTEGVVAATVTEAGLGFIIEVNCQTDFGAKSEVFQDFVRQYLKDPNLINWELNSSLNLVSNQLGEKIVVRRSIYLKPSDNSVMTVYNHPNHLGGKIAVLLEAFVTPGTDKVIEVLGMLDNIALQIAANKPISIDRANLPIDLVEKKIAFYEDEIKQSGSKVKSEQMKEKILTGKMNKWYSEVVLLEQEAIFLEESTPKQTIQNQLESLGVEISLKQFVRYEKGEAQIDSVYDKNVRK